MVSGYKQGLGIYNPLLQSILHHGGKLARNGTPSLTVIALWHGDGCISHSSLPGWTPDHNIVQHNLPVARVPLACDCTCFLAPVAVDVFFPAAPGFPLGTYNIMQHKVVHNVDCNPALQEYMEDLDTRLMWAHACSQLFRNAGIYELK